MPLLSLKQLKDLNKAEPCLCPDCGHAVRKNYCRQCDVYFEAGHIETLCKDKSGGHQGHRTY